ncbi:MAG: hypothetical protein HOP29_11495 [Phycisphaerales bacterium]|nr:hypothetical protein [Phycisphaerales bacterium]
MARKFKEILDFKLEGGEQPHQRRDKLLNELRDLHDKLMDRWNSVGSFLSLESADIRARLAENESILRESQQRARQTGEELAARLVEAKTMLASMQNASAALGVTRFSREFEKAATSHRRWGIVWLFVAAILVGSTVVLAWLFITLLPPLGSIADADAVQRVITKVFILSVSLSASIWASRNYRSHRHLYVVNSHRQSALVTFQTFVEAAGKDEKETRNAVLLEATRCVFSPSVTGYLGPEQETATSNIVEVLNKTIGGKGS